MAKSVYRGPVTFEDGSTAEDVEKFDDGTWINHTAARKRMYGQVMRAASEKAKREIEIPSTQSCTVLQVTASADISGGFATVLIDGDPTGTTRDVTITAAYIPKQGDRAQVAFQQPHGATIVAPLGNSGGDPAGAIQTLVGGSLQVWLDNTVEQVEFNCEEFVTGGVTSDGGTLLRVPKTGIYSVLYTHNMLVEGYGPITAVLYAEHIEAGPRALDSYTYHESTISAKQVTFVAGRAAVKLLAGDILYVILANYSDNTVITTLARMDTAWQVPYDGPLGDCETGDG